MRGIAVLDRIKDPRVVTFTAVVAVPTITGDLMPSTGGILLTGAVTLLLVLALVIGDAPGIADLLLGFRQGRMLLFFLPAAAIFGLGGYGVPPAETALRGLGLPPLAAATVVVLLLAVGVWVGIRAGMGLLLGRVPEADLTGVIVGLLLASVIVSPGLSAAVWAGQMANVLQSLGLGLLLATALSE